MSNAIEIEAKALVSQKDYEKLVKRFKKYPAYTQTNNYIDDDGGILHKEGVSLRIREKEDGIEMTLKTPLSEGLLEKNVPLEKKDFEAYRKEGRFPENDLKRFLTMLGIDVTKLKIQTSLTTKRIDVPYEGGKLSIDDNHYSNKNDFEVELEYNNEADAQRLLEELFKEEKIPFALNKKTKVSRAMEAAGKR
jgi:uncharacterized protein YjbK